MPTSPGVGNDRTDVIALESHVTRIVALGDPHGDVLGLQMVIELEATERATFVSVGDNVGYADGRLSSLFCHLLEDRKIPSVYGNHEEWSRDGRLFLSAGGPTARLTPRANDWCRNLPYRIRYAAAAAPALKVHVTHSLPNWTYVDAESSRRLADIEKADVVLCGHSHHPAVYALKSGEREAVAHAFNPMNKRPLRVPMVSDTRYVVDTGSLARPMVGSRPHLERGTYAVVDLERREIELHAIDKSERLRSMVGAPGASSR